MARVAKQVMAERVRVTAKLLIAGGTVDDILNYARQKGWARSPRLVRQYIARAYAYLGGHDQFEREHVVVRHVSQRRSLYANAVKSGDLRTALAILQDEAKLLGLYPREPVVPPPSPISISATGDVNVSVDMSDDELIEFRGLALRMRQLTAQGAIYDAPPLLPADDHDALQEPGSDAATDDPQHSA